MGIGVHYFSGGKQKSFNLPGVPDPGSEADKVLGLHSATVRKAVDMSEIDPTGYVEGKVSGSLAASQGKMCLKGEEVSPMPVGRVAYSCLDGIRKWSTLNEIDPAGVGSSIGPDPGFADVEAATNSFKLNGAGFSLDVCTRVVMADTDVAGHRRSILYAFFRSIVFSPMGRVVEIGIEKRQVVGMLPEGGGATSKFSVRPIFVEDMLSRIDFGTDADLSAYDEEADTYASADVKSVDVEPCDEEEEAG